MAIRMFSGWLPLLALCLQLLPAVARAEGPVQAEYQVKAAFLYNFARFTNWPVDESGKFRLCILGSNPFDGDIDALRGKPVHDLPLTVSYINNPADAGSCQLLFISKSMTETVAEIIPAVGRYPVLTVSDMDDFINHGGIIGFLQVDNKIRFEINITAASEAGLSISSKLLSLATTVKTGK